VPRPDFTFSDIASLVQLVDEKYICND